MKRTDSNQKNYLPISITATLMAVVIHAYLTLHYYDLKSGTVSGQSFCNINEVLNCDAVSVSKFATLLGIPLALWGLMTNLVLLFFASVTNLNWVENREKTARYALLLSSLTVAASITMAIISFLFMKNICIFCIAAYVLSFIGFWGIFKSIGSIYLSDFASDIKDIFFTERWVGVFLICIPLFSFMANAMYAQSKNLNQIDKMALEKIASWQAAQPYSFDLSRGLTSSTEENRQPKMVIVEFADFRCSHCKHAAPVLHTFIRNHPDVQLILKPFPLDGTCNEAIKNGGDGISCGLAAAVMCSEKISKKGWAVHDYIFENQATIIMKNNLTENIEDIVKNLNIPKKELETCIQDRATTDLLKMMAKEGETAKIQGTPAVFVNGRYLSGGNTLPILEAAYKSLQ